LSSICADNSRPPRASLPASTFAIGRAIVAAVLTWRERSRVRRQLAVMSERELQDMGKCWPEIAYEAGKPFWRK
jgi:uncharacterized protein YjiS (DUF1127 family)